MAESQKRTKESTSFRLSPETLALLTKLAESKGLSQASVIEVALRGMAENNYYTAILIVKRPTSNHWKGLGTHQFAVVPRIGEFIEIVEGEDKQAYLYKVVSVGHPQQPVSRTKIGDVHAVYVGPTSRVLTDMLEDY